MMAKRLPGGGSTVGRVLWPAGWALLLIVSAAVSYFAFVIVGR